jgi:hypothetical protein
MHELLLACTFSFATSANGQSVTAVCPMPVYRVLASCAGEHGEWAVRGPLADNHGSTARCVNGRITDYRIETA